MSLLTPLSLKHPGLEDKELQKLYAVKKLPMEVADKIDRILTQLLAEMNPDARQNNLKKLIQIAIDYRPLQFTEYLWFVNFSCCMLLLRDFSFELNAKRNQLLIKTFTIPTDQWDSCPLKIDTIAKSLYENFLDNDYNLAHVVNNINSYNRLARYVSVSILWAGLFRLMNIETSMFRMRTVSELLKIVNSIDVKKLDSNYERVHRLLSMYSIYQSIVIFCVADYDEYRCFKRYFTVSEIELNTLSNWLSRLNNQLNITYSRNRENIRCADLVEFIELNILNSLDRHRKSLNDSFSSSEVGF